MDYFWTLFSWDNNSILNKNPHVFASFYALNQSGQTEKSFCISWLPKSGQFSVFSPAVEGHNWSLNETLRLTPPACLPLHVYGPQKIRAEFYESADKWRETLESGVIKYKVVDWWDSHSRNCTSAMGQLIKGENKFRVGLKAGHLAARSLWEFYKPYYINENHNFEVIDLVPELQNFHLWKNVKL